MTQKAQAVDSNLQQIIEHFVELCDEAYTNRTSNKAVPWFRPKLESWDGDLQTKQSLIDLHAAFNTDQAEQQLEDTFDAGGDPGNGADTIVLLLQIDYAAQMERAFRARHQNTARALAHYSTRERGHGRATGPLQAASIDYFTSIIKQGSEA